MCEASILNNLCSPVQTVAAALKVESISTRKFLAVAFIAIGSIAAVYAALSAATIGLALAGVKTTFIPASIAAHLPAVTVRNLVIAAAAGLLSVFVVLVGNKVLPTLADVDAYREKHNREDEKGQKEFVADKESHMILNEKFDASKVKTEKK